MEINQNQTNLSPAGSKSSGFSALSKVDESRKKDKESVVELTDAKNSVNAKKSTDAKNLEARDAEKNAKAELEAEKLSSVIQSINQRVQAFQRDLVFSVDKETGKNVVTIVDSKSSEVIKQIPTEEMLELARNLNEQLDENNEANKVANLFSSIA